MSDDIIHITVKEYYDVLNKAEDILREAWEAKKAKYQNKINNAKFGGFFGFGCKKGTDQYTKDWTYGEAWLADKMWFSGSRTFDLNAAGIYDYWQRTVDRFNEIYQIIKSGEGDKEIEIPIGRYSLLLRVLEGDLSAL